MTNFEDKRQARRQRVLKEGQVVSPSASVPHVCTIRNLGDGGARLKFSGPTPGDNEFELVVVAAELSYPAVVRWRKGPELGVAFTGPPKKLPARL